jgi:hypothetical protein
MRLGKEQAAGYVEDSVYLDSTVCSDNTSAGSRELTEDGAAGVHEAPAPEPSLTTR